MSESQWFKSGEENATIEGFFFNLINRLHRNRYFFIALCCDSHSFKFILGTTVTPREIEDIMVIQNFGVFWGILVGSRRY